MSKPAVNEELAKKFFQVNIQTHSKTKGMWSGSFATSVNEEYLFEGGKFSKRNISYPQALYKGIDEIIVNSIDHWIDTRNGPKNSRVSTISIDFTPDGYISIFNSGNGIPIDYVPNEKGELMYVPQLITTEFLAGSKNNNDNERISGGTNGLGIKLTANNSKHFIVETVDLDRKLHYIQEIHDRLNKIEPPSIQPLRKLSSSNPHKKGGTTMKFLPDYKIYGMDIEKSYSELNILFKTRAIHTAAHTGLQVFYNKELIDVKSLEEFAKLFLPEERLVCATLKHPKHPWHIAIGVSDGSYETMSIINGICVNTGTHLNHLRNLIIDGLRPKTERLLKKYTAYKKSMLQNNLFIMISGNIVQPDFDSQSKTNISSPAASYKQWTINKAILDRIWGIMEPRLIEQYISNTSAKLTTRKANTKGIKKYRKADYAATNKSSLCTLLICEGDSAEAMTRTAITSKDVNMSYEYYGTFNIGGVPMNSRVLSAPIRDKNGVVVGFKRQRALIENERLSSLEKVCNLNHGFKYETREELNTLSYGCVTATVDQDLDGVGQIFGLLISHFERFWPALIKHGYLKQLATPIIRAYPKSSKERVEAFYTDKEYRLWVSKISKMAPENLSRWDIKYYKGLATHNDDEAIHMFKSYKNSLYTITYDENASETLNIYYGDDPDLRKKELVTKRSVPNINGMNVSCTDHLQTYTKEFQLDNIIRKLPNIYDGLNQARRKILCGARKRFMSNNNEIKVCQLAGYVSEHMNYQHGNTSLEATIINQAQNYVGANNIPLLLPLSQFGSRIKGGKDCGSSRYIKTKLNRELVRAMFRSEDDYVIDYTYDEGVCGEPVYYVPIVPLVLLESVELPATGWKYAGYAREWSTVYKNVIALIKADDINIQLEDMGFWKNKWNGEVRVANGCSYSVGKYCWDADNDTIEIYELPYQQWNDPWSEKMQEKPEVLQIKDNSSKTQIDIKIKLKPDGFENICKQHGNRGMLEFDVIEDYCKLKKKMDKHLNVIQDGVVRECGDYNEILKEWWIKRRSIYHKRLERLRVITELRIMYLSQVMLFVEHHKKYNFSIINEETAISLLEADGFIKINKPLLDNPGFTPVSEMKNMVCGKGASYNYLFVIGPLQRMEAARMARLKKLNDAKKYLEQLNSPDIVQTTWITELEELAKVMDKGIKHGWLYGEPKANFK
jgi:DNA topoisomerase-2